MGLFTEVVDEQALDNAVSRFRERNILVPTFAEMADPTLAPTSVMKALEGIGPDDPDPLNLWRVHWYNGADRTSRVEAPQYLKLTGELTGVDATIILILGNRFPMIRAHKVQAAFACLAPRDYHRDVRPDVEPCDLAFNRQLRTWRRGDKSHHGLSRSCRVAGGHEPGTLRLARRVD